MNSLQEKYRQEIRPKLAKEFGLKNVLAAPLVEKVVVSMGLGEGAQDKGLVEKAAEDLKVITGQKPKVTKARMAIAGFKIRKGDSIGLMVTLRGKRMYDFLEKLVKIVLPRMRDFHGVSSSSFDGQGNYNLGISEQIVFPEIDYAKIDKVKGLQITIVTDTNNEAQAKRLLEEIGMPFAKAQGLPRGVNLKEKK
ncbi:50S ribosomal protein L5 [Patescibacteria group bacterium]|nr:50S ribosomal protein L5 [Patescibacteria group bacterium]